MLRILSVFLLLIMPVDAHADDVHAIQYLQRKDKTDVQVQGVGVTQATPFAIASIGKTMTSVAMLRLVSRGKIKLSDDARDWLPKDITFGLGGLNGITIRHLLNMTSGLPDYLSDEYMDAAISDPENIQNPRTAISYAFDDDVLFKPGQRFHYSNTNYVLAGIIIEKVTGSTYAEVIKREIFKPSGMKQSFVFGATTLPADFPFGHENGQHERSYYEHQGFGDGGIISPASDLARFYQALFVDKHLLSKTMMAEMTKDPLNENYGMGIEVDGSVFGHTGGDLGFSSEVRIDIKTDIIAIMFVAQDDADTRWVEDVISGR